MSDFKYQVGILGKPWFELDGFKADVTKCLIDIGVTSDEFVFLNENELHLRQKKSPFVGVFFGYNDPISSNHPEISKILEDSLTIIPCVSDLKQYSINVTKELNEVNGLQLEDTKLPDFSRLSNCILENLSLLREDRRIFISYKRKDSRSIALQLYDELQARNFNTFIDTHVIPPAKKMQDSIWHNLADSDVVILLDSPKFKESEWTMLERAQANATSIQILHVLWPTIVEDAGSGLSEFYPLHAEQFCAGSLTGSKARLRSATIKDICSKAEAIRARALALRHAYIVDQFCDLCRDNGMPVNLHPQRYISSSKGGKNRVFVPAIGVPNAYRIYQIENAVKDYHSGATVNVIYDNRGLLDDWSIHLGWLNSHLNVKALPIVEIAEAMGWPDK